MRSFRTFEIGDWVYLKLQPYVQSSMAHWASHKLAFRYFGPYHILQQIGSVAYKLDLPPESAIHPVFHVSRLRATKGFSAPVQPALPSSNSDLQFPMSVLDSRVIMKGNHPVRQVSIQWSNTLAEQATWEDEEYLRNRFPNALAWGQGKGIVRNAASEDEDVAGSIVDNDGEQEEEFQTDNHSGFLKEKRLRRPNPFVSGPEWAV